MTKRKSSAERKLLTVQPEAGAQTVEEAAASEPSGRQRMIAEAAYYRAEKRGFAPGNELEDWLAAEAEVTSVSLQQQPAAAELH